MLQGKFVAQPGTHGAKAEELDCVIVEHERHNVQVVTQARTVFALAVGAAVGLCGVTGYVGLLGYAASQLLVSVWAVSRTGGKVTDYWRDAGVVTYKGMFGPLLDFILIWTLLHNAVHIF